MSELLMEVNAAFGRFVLLWLDEGTPQALEHAGVQLHDLRFVVAAVLLQRRGFVHPWMSGLHSNAFEPCQVQVPDRDCGEHIAVNTAAEERWSVPCAPIVQL